MVACFGRIEAFIQTEQWQETRRIDHSGCRSTDPASPDVTTSNKEISSNVSSQLVPRSECILIQDGKFGWDKEREPTVQGINIAVPSGKLTMVVGPVGCGKSTLLKGILGETATARGSVILSNSSIAFCDQTPWIINGTFRDNIVMFGNTSDPYYDTVIRVCALTHDLGQLENGDQSSLGSKGITLSGGQKQRLVGKIQLR
jgi:ATP-binding cassette subfamily C (CFTR/MRP) protein 1